MAAVRVSVEREGPRVVLALRGDGTRATLNMHHRSAATLALSLGAAANADEDTANECELRAELDTGGNGGGNGG